MKSITKRSGNLELFAVLAEALEPSSVYPYPWIEVVIHLQQQSRLSPKQVREVVLHLRVRELMVPGAATTRSSGFHSDGGTVLIHQPRMKVREAILKILWSRKPNTRPRNSCLNLPSVSQSNEKTRQVSHHSTPFVRSLPFILFLLCLNTFLKRQWCWGELARTWTIPLPPAISHQHKVHYLNYNIEVQSTFSVLLLTNKL